MIRLLESVVALGRGDAVSAPAARILARTLIESSVVTRWMCLPDDPFEREVRWVMMLEHDLRQWKAIVESPHVVAGSGARIGERRKGRLEFAREVRILLEKGGYQFPNGRFPKVFQMVKEIDDERLYLSYRYLSFYSHSSFHAVETFVVGLGTAKQFGEYTTTSDWCGALDVSWYCFYSCALMYLKEIEADVDGFRASARAAS
jgi:hypothetical protein